MADVKVRKLDTWVVDFHKRRAAEAGRSLEDQLRHTLKEAALAPRRDFAKRVKRRLARLRAKYGTMPDSTPGILAERDGRE